MNLEEPRSACGDVNDERPNKRENVLTGRCIASPTRPSPALHQPSMHSRDVLVDLSSPHNVY